MLNDINKHSLKVQMHGYNVVSCEITQNSFMLNDMNKISLKVQIQLNFNISNSEILNTMDMSKSFVSPKHLFLMYFTHDISNTQIS